MKPFVSDPGPAVTLGQAVTRLPRRWPIATMSVLAITVVVAALQFPFPAVLLALWRDPDALAAGQWWRLVTALFVQYDPWWQTVIVLTLIAGIGTVTERVFGPGRWPAWSSPRWATYTAAGLRPGGAAAVAGSEGVSGWPAIPPLRHCWRTRCSCRSGRRSPRWPW
jgi:hypothetical protein